MYRKTHCYYCGGRLVEKEWGTRYVSRKSITYECIDLVKPENYQELLADLRARTGLDITR